MRSKAGGSRAGFVLAAMLLLCIILLSILGLARSRLSVHTMRDVARVCAGGVAQEVARSALEEALAAVQRRSNAPGDPIFQALREQPDPSRTLEWPLEVPGLAATLGSDPGWRDYELVGGRVKVALRSVERVDGDPGANQARLDLSARARHRSTGVVRELRAERRCQTRLLTVPRPFDSATIVILEPDRLLEGVNEAISAAVTDMNELVNVVLPGAIASLEQRGRPDLAGRLGQLELPPFPSLTDPDSPYQAFPERPVLFTQALRFPSLVDLDLGRAVARREEQVAAHRDAYEAAMGRLVEATEQSASVETLLDDWRSTIEALYRANHGVLDAVKQYQDRFRAIPAPQSARVREQAAALAERAWRARSTFRFSGPRAVRDFLHFLDRYPRASGIAMVDNRNGPVLTLTNRQLAGKLVIVATGDLDVRGLEPGDAGRDLVTLQAFGQLRLAGQVQAAIVVGPGARLTCAPDTRILGNLIFVGEVDPTLLAGALDNTGRRHFSGDGERPESEYIHALWAPWSARTRVLRQ